MTSVYEGSQADASLLNPSLSAGLRILSQDQEVAFVQYVRYVLPLDGFVFWLRTASVAVTGSLHVGAHRRQEEDATTTINSIMFTTSTPTQFLDAVEPDRLWVGEFEGLRFAFSQLSPRYRSARLFHYIGDAVYPTMASQLVEVGDQLPLDTLIVSNSLPVWLTLATYDPIWLNAPNPAIPLFPSFLAPDNLRPPYATIHVGPRDTSAIQAIPALDPVNTSQYQLAQDRVRITLFGATNEQVMDFYNLVFQYSRDTDAIGIADASIVMDDKSPQPEISALAMKKAMEFVVTYNQGTTRTLARALIKKALATFAGVNPPAFTPTPV